MTEELIKMAAEKHKIDFLTIEVVAREGKVILRAPYMTAAFIKYIESWRPVSAYIEYHYTRGFINWLAWKMRLRNTNNVPPVTGLSFSKRR